MFLLVWHFCRFPCTAWGTVKFTYITCVKWGSAMKQQEFTCDTGMCIPKINPVSPSHYKQGNIECIEAIDAACVYLSNSEAFYVGNVIKYMWRWKIKNGLEDLYKAREYLDKLISKIERDKTVG